MMSTHDTTPLTPAPNEGMAPEGDPSYRDIFNATSDGLVILDETGTILRANDRFCELVGFSNQELICLSISDLSSDQPPHTQAEALKHVRRAFDQGSCVYTWRTKPKSGEVFWSEVALRSCAIAGQKRLIASVRNIEARKRAEDQLQASEERFSRIFHNCSNGMALTQFDSGRIVDVNLAWIQATGFDREQSLGKTALELGIWANPADRDTWSAALERGDRLREVELTLVMKSSRRAHMVSAEAMVVGNQRYVLWEFRDIQEQKQAEQQNNDAMRYVQTLLAASPIGIITYKASGEAVSANEAAATLIGANLDNVRNQNFRKLESWRKSGFLKMAELALATGQDQVFESHIVTSFGLSVWLSNRFVPFRFAGEPHLLLLSHDVSERKRLEEERQVTVELLQTINAAGELPALLKTVTHLLRDWSDCEAVGIRLREGSDFPYFETRGFPEEFVLAEKELCSFDCRGELVRDEQGNPVLECMCGNIICGRFDPTKPFFTSQGSFWTNSTSRLLASTTAADRQARTRNRCNGEGYESVALIPLLAGGETLGLLQFNDHQTGRFTSPKIALLERLAGSLAAALTQRKMQRILQESEERYRSLVTSSLDAVLLTQPDGDILNANQAACGMFGYSERQLIEAKRTGIVDTSDPRLPLALEERSRTGRFSGELIFVRSNGQRFTGDVSSSSFTDSQGHLRTSTVIRDTTERKRLEESALRFAAIVESSEDAIIGKDLNGTITSWNHGSEVIYGYTTEEMLGRSISRLIPIHSQHELTEFLEAIKSGKHIQHYETVRCRKDGTEIHVSLTISPIHDRQGNIVGASTIARDISLRRRADEELRGLNRRLRAMGACHQALLRAKDEPSLLQEVCRIICDAADYRMAWVGFAMQDDRKSVKPVAWGGTVEGYLDNLDITWADDAHGRGLTGTCIRTGKACYVNNFITDPRTEPWRQEALQRHYRSAIGLPLSDENGETFGALSIYSSLPSAVTPDEIRLLTDLAQDLAFGISNLRLREQQKQAEAELRKLSQAVNQSPASIVITNPIGLIEYVNPKFTSVTGYLLEEVKGKNPRVLKGDKTPREEYQRLWQNITHGREWRGEFHNRKKNGEFYWEYVSISPIIDAEGRTTHFLAVKEDITERKVLEQSFRQAQKMEAVGQLAGGVAHDYNNMLASLTLHLGLLQQREDLDQETRETLAELLIDTKRTADLTRQLLMFSRKSVMQVKSLDMNVVVANLLKMLKRLIGENITMHFEPNVTLPCVQADPGMMEQVLMNLCVNARDAMPKGGHLTIRVEAVNADEARTRSHPGAQPGPYASLSVADTGTGMDESTIAHIFEPFFTTKEAGKGTGLGLATVHGIAAQHKGWVEVESELGKGTVFRVFFPSATDVMPESKELVKMPVLRGHETILLVEDEDGLRRIVRQALQKCGYRVLEAANGHEALKMWHEYHGQIDLLFSDVMMPQGMTGHELAEKLRENRPNLRIILSSGYNPEMTKPDKPNTKDIMLLQKPYQFEVISKVVRECLDGK